MSYIDCDKCRYGEIECFKCEGSGQVDCRPCDGDGVLYCRACDGHGIYSDSGKPCKRCGGDRTVGCLKCNGSGKLNCLKCDGTGRLTCRKCNGTAKVESKWEEKPCAGNSPRCEGTIRYHVDWGRVPNYCKACKDAWKEKPCPGDSPKCEGTIRYREDWDNVPNYCKACKDAWKDRPKYRDGRAGILKFNKDQQQWHEHHGWGKKGDLYRPDGDINFDDTTPDGKHSHTARDKKFNVRYHRNEGDKK